MAITRSMRVVSWDGNLINDGTNYSAHLITPDALPPAQANMVERHGRWPLFGALGRPAWKIPLRIIIHNEDLKTYQKQLHQWFDPDDETLKQLVMEDLDGTDDRYWEAICERLQKDPSTPGDIYVATLAINNDVRLRSSALVTPANWSITATGQTNAYTVAGEDDVYPKITLTPLTARTGEYLYRRFITVRWRADEAGSKYPVDITNDSFNTTGGATGQADGDDLRVWVDGVEVDRWLDGMNTTTTKIFVNLDFEANQEGTLDGAINSTVTTITVNESINNFPLEGILLIDTEVISYTGKNNQKKEFTGCLRGDKGSAAATHTDATAVYWLQHDIWLVYDKATATAPTVDDNYKPAFDLSTSTNTSWDYNNFGNDALKATGRWIKNYGAGSPEFYTANRNTNADPWSEIGIYTVPDFEGSNVGFYSIFNPCGITAANFQNGEKYTDNKANWKSYTGQVRTFTDVWASSYNIPAPSADTTWEAWSQNLTSLSGVTGVALYASGGPVQAFQFNAVECADVTLTLNSSNTPVISIGSEKDNYTFDCTITNNTTGDAIKINFSCIDNGAADDKLIIDTSAKTVTFYPRNKGGSNEFSALTLIGGARKEWLKLQPGSNTLQYDETGVTSVTLAMEYRNRYFA